MTAVDPNPERLSNHSRAWLGGSRWWRRLEATLGVTLCHLCSPHFDDYMELFELNAARMVTVLVAVPVTHPAWGARWARLIAAWRCIAERGGPGPIASAELALGDLLVFPGNSAEACEHQIAGEVVQAGTLTAAEEALLAAAGADLPQAQLADAVDATCFVWPSARVRLTFMLDAACPVRFPCHARITPEQRREIDAEHEGSAALAAAAAAAEARD